MNTGQSTRASSGCTRTGASQTQGKAAGESWMQDAELDLLMRAGRSGYVTMDTINMAVVQLE